MGTETASGGSPSAAFETRGLIRLVKSDPAQQVRKPRVVAQWIKEGMNLEVLQNRCVLLIGALKPGKCLFVVAESQVSIHKGNSGNVSRLLSSFQFIKKAERVSTTPGMRISKRAGRLWLGGCSPC